MWMAHHRNLREGSEQGVVLVGDVTVVGVATVVGVVADGSVRDVMLV